MVGRGRPPIGPRVTIRLEPDTRARLDEIAVHSDLALADVVRLMLDAALARIDTHGLPAYLDLPGEPVDGYTMAVMRERVNRRWRQP